MLVGRLTSIRRGGGHPCRRATVVSRLAVGTAVVAMALALPLPLRAVAEAAPRPEDGREQLPADRADDQRERMVYPPAFFARYEPITALDMVRRVPGFQLSDGSDTRGLSGATGNVLINGRRPSSKEDAPSDILARIPTGKVAYLELIRRQVRGIDMRGEPVLVNVVLSEDVGMALQWEASGRYNFDVSPATWEGRTSVADQWRGVEFNVGVHGRKSASGEEGTERFLDSDDRLFEEEYFDSYTRTDQTDANLNASTWAGDTLVHLNAEASREGRTDTSARQLVSVAGAETLGNEVVGRDIDGSSLEIGLDAERALPRSVLGKVIALYTREEAEVGTSQRILAPGGSQTLFRIGDEETLATETIGRVELNWTGAENHVVQVNAEGARNVLDSALELTRDTGAGPVDVPVPNADTKVKEIRWSLEVRDAWTLNPQWEVSYGLGGEWSTISQSGEVSQERSFSYLKPQATLVYSPDQARQFRLNVEREISQLDFADFATATRFEDDRLLFGNPDLRPASTWITELGYEQRYGRRSAVELTAFYHRISDVIDLLPLTPTVEVPGNIGDGHRVGLRLESRIELDALGLRAAELDLQGRWQKSSVEDPVTGESRRLSSDERDWNKPLPLEGDHEYAVAVGFRQDFSKAQLAWGFDVYSRAGRPHYRVDRLDVYDEDVELNAFVESTRWLGLKIRLSVANALNMPQLRDRTVYLGGRGLSPVDYLSRFEQTDGTRLQLTVSGGF